MKIVIDIPKSIWNKIQQDINYFGELDVYDAKLLTHPIEEAIIIKESDEEEE